MMMMMITIITICDVTDGKRRKKETLDTWNKNMEVQQSLFFLLKFYHLSCSMLKKGCLEWPKSTCSAVICPNPAMPCVSNLPPGSPGRCHCGTCTTLASTKQPTNGSTASSTESAGIFVVGVFLHEIMVWNRKIQPRNKEKEGKDLWGQWAHIPLFLVKLRPPFVFFFLTSAPFFRQHPSKFWWPMISGVSVGHFRFHPTSKHPPGKIILQNETVETSSCGSGLNSSAQLGWQVSTGDPNALPERQQQSQGCERLRLIPSRLGARNLAISTYCWWFRKKIPRPNQPPVGWC